MQFTFKQTNGDIYDLDGGEVIFSFREARGPEAELIYTTSSDGGDISIDVETGVVLLDIPVTEVLNFEAGEGYYDMVLAFGSEQWDTFIEGEVSLTDGVTYPEAP